jgi:hypothetical protein
MGWSLMVGYEGGCRGAGVALVGAYPIVAWLDEGVCGCWIERFDFQLPAMSCELPAFS